MEIKTNLTVKIFQGKKPNKRQLGTTRTNAKTKIKQVGLNN